VLAVLAIVPLLDGGEGNSVPSVEEKNEGVDSEAFNFRATEVTRHKEGRKGHYWTLSGEG